MSEDMSNLIDTFKNILHNNEQNLNNNTPTSSDTDSSYANNNSQNNNTSSSVENNNLSISPEMISNIANMLKNTNFSNNNSNENNSNSQNSENSSSSYTNNQGSPSIDFETIMKIKSIMDTLNKKDDPRSKLLYSLKPYLRKTRQDKLDQYVNLLKITQVTDIFNLKKGDKK